MEKHLVWGHYHGLPANCHKLDPFMYIQSTDALKDYGLLQEIDLSGQEADEA